MGMKKETDMFSGVHDRSHENDIGQQQNQNCTIIYVRHIIKNANR